ncbi:MAG: nucleoside deaminase [Limnothrix sp.]
MKNEKFMQMAISLSEENVFQNKKQPFGAVVVKNGEVIGKAFNEVDKQNDPTAHAEIMAIRRACETVGSAQLEGCELYTSAEPCPMCIGAIYWSQLEKVYFGNSKEDAKEAGFSDQFIYEELDHPAEKRDLPMEQTMRDEANGAFQEWCKQQDDKD